MREDPGCRDKDVEGESVGLIECPESLRAVTIAPEGGLVADGEGGSADGTKLGLLGEAA